MKYYIIIYLLISSLFAQSVRDILGKDTDIINNILISHNVSQKKRKDILVDIAKAKSKHSPSEKAFRECLENYALDASPKTVGGGTE